MARIPRPYDSAEPGLRPASSIAQINEGVAGRIGSAGNAMGRAIEAIGGAFADVAMRSAEAQDSTNAARAKLDFLKFDNDAWTGLQNGVSQNGDGWERAGDVYKQGVTDIMSKYPVSDPKRRQDLSMFLERQVAERGFQAARQQQSMRGTYYRGIEDQEINGAALRVEANPSQDTVDALRGSLTELVESGRGYYASNAAIEQRKRQIEGALLMGQYRGLLKTDPEAASALMDKIRKGEYEIDARSAPGGPPLTRPTIAPSTGDGPDLRRNGGPASVRYNNPGAMYPGPSSRKFGSIGTEIIGGGHKIAVFPDAVSGAAAQFDLLANKYTGQSVAAAISKWSGGNSVETYLSVLKREAGVNPNDTLTREMVQDPRIAIPLAKAMAVQEAGRPYPLSDSQWAQAHAMAFGQGGPQASGRGTPGRDVIEIAGKSPQEVTAALAAAHGRGNRDMLFVNDSNPRVIARPGQERWQPRDPQAAQFSGPQFANEFLASQPGYRATRLPGGSEGSGSVSGSGNLQETLAQAANDNPNAEVRSLVPPEALASLSEQFPELTLPENLTVGEAAKLVEQATGQRITTRDDQLLPMGRLRSGQVFSVKSKHGDITVSADAINSLDKGMVRKLQQDAREQVRIKQREQDVIAEDMAKRELLTQESQGKSHSEFDRSVLEQAWRKTPKKLADFDRKLSVARSMNEVTADAANVPGDVLEERLERIKSRVVDEYGDADPVAQAAVDRAEKRVKAIQSLRQNDPARAVRDSQEVKAVQSQLPGGDPQNKAHAYQLVDATLKAQKRLGIAQVPITKVEARTIMSDIIFAPEKDKRRVADETAMRVAETYGGHAETVLAAAMKLTSGDTRDDDDMVGSALRRLRRQSSDVDKAVKGAAPKADRLPAAKPNFFNQFQ